MKTKLPWGKELAIFPPEVAACFGPWVSTLSHLFASQTLQHKDAASPDGYSGVGQKGNYERLLLSEWALLDTAPEEFVRRASANEHLFYQLERRDHSAHRETLVLFDNGIAQIGSPRLMHLAILVALEKRAARAKGCLLWGLLHDLEHRVHPKFTHEEYAIWQSSLVERATGLGEIERWGSFYPSLNKLSLRGPGAKGAARTPEQTFGSERKDPCSNVAECWIVGGERLRDVAISRGYSFVSVEDALRLGTEALRVSVISNGPTSSRAREAELTLPSPNASLRMLRNPFAEAAPQKERERPREASTPDPDSYAVTRVLLSRDGRRVHALTSDGSVLSRPVPNATDTSASKWRRFHPEKHLFQKHGKGRLLAVGSAPNGQDEYLLLTTAESRERSLVLYVAVKNGFRALTPILIPDTERFDPTTEIQGLVCWQHDVHFAAWTKTWTRGNRALSLFRIDKAHHPRIPSWGSSVKEVAKLLVPELQADARHCTVAFIDEEGTPRVANTTGQTSTPWFSGGSSINEFVIGAAGELGWRAYIDDGQDRDGHTRWMTMKGGIGLDGAGYRKDPALTTMARLKGKVIGIGSKYGKDADDILFVHEDDRVVRFSMREKQVLGTITGAETDVKQATMSLTGEIATLRSDGSICVYSTAKEAMLMTAVEVVVSGKKSALVAEGEIP